MATIVLQAAGGALGGIVGGPLGAIAGRAVGGLAGRMVDERLFARGRSVEGPRLAAGRIVDADEGAGIARAYGTVRIAGQVIWMTRFEETTSVERTGGKGGPPASETVSYSYFGNVAIGLCEGPVAHLRRVWADGEELDLAEIDMRFYHGTGDQPVDPLIEAKQGAGNAPAYRGLAYVVFERLPLARFGNRIPQIACEVVRPVGELEPAIRAITIIPGANEHGLDPVTVRERVGAGEDRTPNRNIRHGGNDFSASLDELTALCLNLERAALVVAWFADDLRAGRAAVRPGVEAVARDETEDWRAGGVDRSGARLVSQSGGGPAYGGTPSDAGVVRAIQAMAAAGLKVTVYPFLLMDVPAGTPLPDPYGGTRQAPYPWRGRMTLDLAETMPGSADRTQVARADIARFVGTAAPAHFIVTADGVDYAGPAEWSYRRMILHQAALAKRAGGVDAFVIGSEMRGLTRLRDAAGAFPFVEALIALARDVKAMLPGTTVTYAADWSEYFGYQPADGSGDVFYNLDPLWADAAIDVVGIDNYMPLADWRVEDWDGGPDGAASPYDLGPLSAGITGGEQAEWYYASEADRRARRRTPITDGLGKPWVFRPKDLVSWWSNRHVDRRGGAELAGHSPWVPKSKPIWLTELGCPAVDKGANQPNVFVDPKSAESALPHFSTGARDDHQQRRFLEAHLAHWGEAANNPVSPLYGRPMVETDAVHLWTWDTRPYPAFPQLASVWRDGGNWQRGHWLSGRLGKAPLGAVINAILADHGLPAADVTAVDGEVGGYLLQGPGSARGEIEEIARLGRIDAVARGGTLAFRSRRRAVAPIVIDVLAEDGDGPLKERRRSEDGESAEEVIVGYNDAARNYEPGSVSAVTARRRSARKRRVELPVVLDESEARRFAEDLLAAEGGGRETIRFALSPADLGPEPGDVVALDDVPGRWLIERVEDGAARRVEAVQLGPMAYDGADDVRSGEDAPAPVPPQAASRPVVALLDLPGGDALDERAIAAVFARPWMPYAIGSARGGAFVRRALAERPSTMGRLAAALPPGPEAVVDRGNVLVVDLFGGSLASAAPGAVLAGANRAAVETAVGWEIVQFEHAEEVAPQRFALTGLVRGARGTDDATRVGASAGALFVLLDGAPMALPLGEDEVGLSTQWRIAPAGRSLDDPAAVSVQVALGLRAERPRSPVHLTARFAQDGGVRFDWVRRTRVGGDRFDALEVPLGEAAERYAVRIDAGGTIERQTEAATLTLSAEEQVAAFGGVSASLQLSVSQISSSAGRGVSRTRLFTRPSASAAPEQGESA